MTNNYLAEKLITKLREAGALLSDDDLAARRAVSALMTRFEWTFSLCEERKRKKKKALDAGVQVMKFIIESRSEESGAYDLEKAYAMACKRLHFPDKSHKGCACIVAI